MFNILELQSKDYYERDLTLQSLSRNTDYMIDCRSMTAGRECLLRDAERSMRLALNKTKVIFL